MPGMPAAHRYQPFAPIDIPDRTWPGKVITARCGLRPYRTTVRLELNGRIIHNYGHGGAGYTLARGCAEEVSRLLEA